MSERPQPWTLAPRVIGTHGDCPLFHRTTDRRNFCRGALATLALTLLATAATASWASAAG